MRRQVIVFFVLSLASVIRAQTPTPSGVNVKLSFADNKTVYRIGEQIKLVMEFTTDRDDYVLEIMPDGTRPGLDIIVISPDTGITRWVDELTDNRQWPRHTFSSQKLTSTPKLVETILNDTLRFDSPGRYTVSVTTRRVWPASSFNVPEQPAPLSTNSISFEVQTMSEEDEAKEVKRLSELLAVQRDSYSAETIAKQFSYLTGDTSTREKVRRFLTADERRSNEHLWNGLFIARNRALVLKLLENALRDPNVPVTSQILRATTRIKTLLTHGVREKPSDPTRWSMEPENPRAIEIRNAYIVELAAGLAKRTGSSQTTTAATIVSVAPKDSQATNAGLREARRILVQQFDTLPSRTRQWLLESHWEALRGTAFIPSLKKMLAGSGPDTKYDHEAALRRLIEFAPDEARPYVIAEIRDPGSFVDPKILQAFEEKSLPEVDASLLEQIRSAAALASNRDRGHLRLRTILLARFATDSIYQELMELYRSIETKLPGEARAGLLAYFAKHNEQEGLTLIEEAVAELKPDEYPQLLRELTSLYYSDGIDRLLKKNLETDKVSLASTAAYLIGQHGSPGDERLLEARLRRWREEWRDRAADADAQQQYQIELEIIEALVNGKSWKLSPERVQELKNSCITQLCKQHYVAR